MPAKNSQKFSSTFPKIIPTIIGNAKSNIDVGVISAIPSIERVINVKIGTEIIAVIAALATSYSSP